MDVSLVSDGCYSWFEQFHLAGDGKVMVTVMLCVILA